MVARLDIRKAIPGIQGLHLHAVKTDTKVLTNILLNLDFKIYIIDGAKIRDERSFFIEVAKVFNFPRYFGNNWDAWNECLGEFSQSLLANRYAVIWEHADQTLEMDPQTFLEAVCDLDRLSANYNVSMQHSQKRVQHKQVEIFLLGSRNGFNPLLPMTSAQ